MTIYEIKAHVIESGQLSYREVTGAVNGYPEPITGFAVKGFANFEEAEGFADEYNGRVVTGYYRDGWDLCNDRGWRTKPLSASDYINDLNEAYEVDPMDELEMLIEHLSEDLEDAEDLTTVKQMKSLIEVKGDLKQGEIIYSHYGNYDTISETLMGYHEDVHNWFVGVYFEYKS